MCYSGSVTQEEKAVQQDDVRVIHTPQARFGGRAAADAANRSQQALSEHADFFESEQHQQKVDAVMDIVSNFFSARKNIYVNHRANGGRPFTVVKVANPQFPRMSSRDIDRLYRDPLKQLGVEIVFSKNTLSYLYRVR